MENAQMRLGSLRRGPSRGATVRSCQRKLSSWRSGVLRAWTSLDARFAHAVQESGLAAIARPPCPIPRGSRNILPREAANTRSELVCAKYPAHPPAYEWKAHVALAAAFGP